MTQTIDLMLTLLEIFDAPRPAETQGSSLLPVLAADDPEQAERGCNYPDLVVYGWQGVIVSAGTPASIVARLSAEIGKALSDPELSQRLRSLSEYGTSPAYLDTPAFKAYIDAEAKRWAGMIRSANIRLE